MFYKPTNPQGIQTNCRLHVNTSLLAASFSPSPATLSVRTSINTPNQKARGQVVGQPPVKRSQCLKKHSTGGDVTGGLSSYKFKQVHKVGCLMILGNKGSGQESVTENTSAHDTFMCFNMKIVTYNYSAGA